jgi:O-antigen/teichoic acid export membrane protein
MPVGLVANLRWQYVANVAVAVLGGLYLLLLGRSLGAEHFGLYSACTAYAALVFGIVEFRLQEATIRFVDISERSNNSTVFQHIEALFTLDIFIKLLAGAISLICVPFFVQHLSLGSRNNTVVVLCLLNLILTKTGNPVAIGLLRSANFFNLHAIVLLVEWFTRLIITVLIIFFGKSSLIGILIVSCAVGFVSNLFLIVLACRAVGFRPAYLFLGGRYELTDSLRLMLSFIAPSYGISLLDNIAKEADIAVVALFLPLPIVGIYKMAKSMVLILWKAADPFFLVLMPTLVNFVRVGDVLGVKRFLRMFTISLAGVAILMAGSSIIVVPLIAPLMLGSQFAAVGGVFPIMVLWIIVSLPLIWTHAYAAAINRPVLQLVGNLFGNGILLILLFVLTPRWGLVGAAIALSIGLAGCFAGAFFVLWVTDAFGEKVINRSAHAR